MGKCPYCLSEVDPNNPVIALEALREYVESQGGWHIFEGREITDGLSFTSNGRAFDINIADSKTSYNSGDIDYDHHFYDGLPQGSEFTTYIVFEWNGHYFKITGTGDSYGEVDWNGDLRVVFPKKEIRLIFEDGNEN